MKIFCGILALSLLTVHGKIFAQETPAPNAPIEQQSPVIESEAMALLKKNQQTMLGFKTFYAECRTTLTREKPIENRPTIRYEIATLTAEKPNKMRYDGWNSKTDPSTTGWKVPTEPALYTFACNGKEMWMQFGAHYRKSPKTTPDYMHTNLEPWGGFYTKDASPYGSALYYQQKNELREARLVGSEMVDGIPCTKVFVSDLSTYGSQKVESRNTWYIGPDNLVHRCISYTKFAAEPGMTRDAILVNIQTNRTIVPKIYAYAPPPGVTLEVPEPAVPLLAKGVAAPEFTALDVENKPIKLSDYKGKIVVIDFWASWCGPCMASMPHTQSVAKKLQAQGLPVVLLAVDNSEERPAFETWVKAKRAEYSALNFVHIPPKEQVLSKQFQVTGIPTQYVLDQNGVICASFVGYDRPNNDLEKAIRAALVAHKDK